MRDDWNQATHFPFKKLDIPDDTSLLEFDLSVRAVNCLNFAGWFTWKHLKEKSEREVLNQYGLGRKTYNELREAALGYQWCLNNAPARNYLEAYDRAVGA